MKCLENNLIPVVADENDTPLITSQTQLKILGQLQIIPAIVRTRFTTQSSSFSDLFSSSQSNISFSLTQRIKIYRVSSVPLSPFRDTSFASNSRTGVTSSYD